MIFSGIIQWSLRNGILVLLASLALLVLGLRIAQQLPIDVLPDLTRPTVVVNTEMPGFAPEDVEVLTTVPIETALGGLPDVGRIRSVSGPGLSLVFAEFGWGTDVFRNRQLVSERLEAVRPQLPDGVQPRIGPLTSLMGEIMLISLQADNDAINPAQLRDTADWSWRPALLGIQGVSQVTTIGGDVRQYEIRPDPERMRLLGVTLTEVEEAARGFGRDVGGGLLEAAGQEFTVRVRGRPFRLENLREVAVAWRGSAAIRLKQVAEITEGVRLKRGEAGANGHPAVILAIQKQPGADTLALTRVIEGRLAALDPGLPEGATRSTLFRQADFIERSVANVRESVIYASFIVALVVFGFLHSGRLTLVTLTAIPLSIVAAIIALRGFGLSVNTMTLGGLAIAVGELVDDAVIGVENVVRRTKAVLAERKDGKVIDLSAVIAQATVEVRSGILYATAIIVLVLLPLFALEGIEGRLFAALGIAYIAAILGSLLVSITLTPVLCRLILERISVRQREQRWVLGLKHRYTEILGRVLENPRNVLIIAGAMVAITILAAAGLPRAFLPAFNESTLTVNLILQPGISLAESDRLGQVAEQLLLKVPEVSRVGRRTGRAELDEHAEGVHYTELEVGLHDAGRERSEVIADIRSRLSVLPGTLATGQPISHRLDHLLTGVRAPLVVKVFGMDLPTLRLIAGQVRQRLEVIPGLADVQIEKQVDVAQLNIIPDVQSAAVYGISPVRVQETLNGIVVGRKLSQIVQDERRYDLVVRLPENLRSTSALGQLPIETPSGSVPLGWLATLKESVGPNQILREQQRRRLVVAAFAGEGNFNRAGREAQRRLADLKLPPGYEIHVEGEISAQQEALKRIGILSLLSLLLMGGVLYARYHSVPLVLIILGNIPLAMAGGILAMAITATPLSVASLIGFVTLAGISARNGILKISHFIYLARHEGERFGRELILRGASERLVPVLMTALIAGLALVPLLLAGDQPGKEILHPVALVIFGGLFSSTLLDSFITPTLFALFGRRPLHDLLDKRLADADF